MGIYPEISDEFDPGFPRDSYNRGESIIVTPYVPDYSDDMPYCDIGGDDFPFEVIGGKKKKKKAVKHRNKVVRRTFKMPMRNPALTAIPTDDTYSPLESQYEEDYYSNYPSTTNYDGSGYYSEEFGAKARGGRRPQASAFRKANTAARGSVSRRGSVSHNPKSSPRRQQQAKNPRQDAFAEPFYSENKYPNRPTSYGAPYQAAPNNLYPGQQMAYPYQQYPYPDAGGGGGMTSERGEDPYAYLFDDYDDEGYDNYEEYSGEPKKKVSHRKLKPNKMIASRGQIISQFKKKQQVDRIKTSAEQANAVSKATKRIRAQEAVKKEFEEKLQNLEHEIERRDIAESTRQKLEAQADEYENLIADIQESQRVELDQIRANEERYRQPDSDPTFIVQEDDDSVSGVAIIPTNEGAITVGASIDLAPIYAEVMTEMNNQVGLSFTGFFKKIGKIAKKIANSRIVKRLSGLAKTAASMYTGGASDKFFDAAKGMTGPIIKRLQNKDPNAIALVQKIVTDAKNGDPNAATALAALNKEVEKAGVDTMKQIPSSVSGYGVVGADYLVGDDYVVGAMCGVKHV